MDDIIKSIEAGRFTAREYTLSTLGVTIWVGNGWLFYGFYPSAGTAFTIGEKLRLRRAIKRGMTKKALAAANELTKGETK